MLDFVSLMEQTLVLSVAKKPLQWFPSSGKEAAHKSNEPSQPIAGAVKHPDQRNSPHTSHTAMAEPAKEGPSGNNPLGFERKGITYHPYLESPGISEELAAVCAEEDARSLLRPQPFVYRDNFFVIAHDDIRSEAIHVRSELEDSSGIVA